MIPIMAKFPALLVRAGFGIAMAGAACVAYGIVIERRWYRRRDYILPILRPGSTGFTVLHLSDLHFLRTDERKARFLASLPQPDVAVITGDILGEPEGVETAVPALRAVRGRSASYFVLGSNDYFAPRPLNYANYFRRERRRRIGLRGRSEDLIRLLEADGWQHLRNRKDFLAADGLRLEVLGLDDPHIERHDLRVAPRA